MFSYRKRLIFPVYIEHPDKKLAVYLLKDFQGPDSELASFIRYMNHRLKVVDPHIRNLLGMIAAEEMGHWELIGTAIQKLGLPDLPFPTTAVGDGTAPAGEGTASVGDVPDGEAEETKILLMLKTDREAEEKAKKRYQKLTGLTNDANLQKMFRFLSGREAVHERLMMKTVDLLKSGAGKEHLVGVIREYRMSLRVIT